MYNIYDVNLPKVLISEVIEDNQILPKNYKEALLIPKWKDSMDGEFKTLLDNNTCSLIGPKPNMNVIGCKWVFMIKRKSNGSVERYKARLVAQGYKQQKM